MSTIDNTPRLTAPDDRLTVAELALVLDRCPEECRRYARGEVAFPVRAVKVAGQWTWSTAAVARMLDGAK